MAEHRADVARTETAGVVQIMITAILITIGYTISIGIGYCIGHAFGRKRGRDEQWVDDFFAYANKAKAQSERLKRNKFGQFIPRT